MLMEQYLIVIIINNDRKRSNSDLDLEVIIEISGISSKNDREEVFCPCVLIYCGQHCEVF